MHVVHTNAGVVASGLVGEISLDLWKWVLDVDLWSVIHGVRTFAPLLTAQGEGHIVNTASTAGLQGAVADAFRSRAGATLANDGLDPAEVAQMVLDGIVQNRFWIITHPAWHGIMADRVAAMGDGVLHHGFGG